MSDLKSIVTTTSIPQQKYGVNIQSSIAFHSEPSSYKMKKKKLKQKIIKEDESSIKEEVVQKTAFDIPGVATLILSPISQKVIGCTIGENVSAENPWTYVKKDLIEDNIELHEESSEFLGIANDIELYPESKILIGWIPAASEKHDKFYVVYTLEAKDAVLREIEKNKNIMKEKLQRQVSRSAGKWKSLGSEIEVNESLIQNFRPLYEVEITSKFPLCTKSVKFKMRKVEDISDGYVELLQDVRYPIENIERKRIDMAIQSTKAKISREVQTKPTYPVNIGTQYEFSEYNLKTPEKKEPPKMLPSRIPTNEPINLLNIHDVLENLVLNEHVNIYKDDYAALELKKRIKYISDHMQRFLTCSDQTSTQGKRISDCSWSCFYSGIVAACYTDYSITSIIRKHEETDYFYNAGAASSVPPPPVLIWSYTDGLKPKLYLQSPRQVTYVSWCPYEKDLLVGGLINGQIIVWDLTNKLQDVEKPEILTMTQKHNRLNLLSLMNWSKHTRNVAVVEPTIVSDLSCSHKTCVSHICWLPYCCEITKNGKYRCTEGIITKQFSTLSGDGTVLLWDLNMKASENKSKSVERKLKRMKKIPSALLPKQTNLTELGKYFKPHYKITFKDLPILTTLRTTPFNRYNSIDSYVDPRPQIRTKYTFPLNQEVRKDFDKFIFGTGLGHMFKAKIKGYDFDLGTQISTEEAIIEHYESIHDGPITFLEEHPSLSEFILTIGGCIFAIWHKENKQALFWRKSTQGLKYLTGGWILLRAGCILLLRSDGAFEFWDLLINDIKPIKVIATGGDAVLTLFGFLTSAHNTKGTFAFCNNLGTLIIYFWPELFKLISSDDKLLMKNLLTRFNERKIILEKWIERFINNYDPTSHEQSQLRLDSVLTTRNEMHEIRIATKGYRASGNFSEIDKMNKIFDDAQWNSQEEKQNFQTMLDRKRINLQELKVYRESLLRDEKQKEEKSLKQLIILGNKNKIFVQESTKILGPRDHLREQRKYYEEEIIDSNDLEYINEYDEIEYKAMFFITNHPYKHNFEWNKLMRKGNTTHKNIQDWFKKQSRSTTRCRMQQPPRPMRQTSNFNQSFLQIQKTPGN